MSKIRGFIFLSTLVMPAFVFGHVCDGIGNGQAHKALSMGGMTACIVYEKAPILKDGQLSRDPDGLAIYSVSKSGAQKLIYEFAYAGTTGKINDVFVLYDDATSNEILFVIHSIEAPRSWDVLSDVYDVNVFVLMENGLIRDKHRSGFFDMGGDMSGSDGEVSYTYPYKDKESVEMVFRSGLFKVLHAPFAVGGIVKEKSLLYAEPVMQEPSKMYLIKGDQVMIGESMAGWCKVLYRGKTKPITMWMQCKSIAYLEG